MDTSTATSVVKANAVRRETVVAPFGRPRRPARTRSRELRPVGASPLPNPRRDLSMFPADTAPVAPLRSDRGQRLDPLLPPVISEPARRRRAAAATAVGSARPVTAGRPSPGEPLPAPLAAARGRRARLTARGRAAVLGLLVGGVALCSAVTVGATEPAPAIESTQVVARGGESVEAVAARAADGRDVHQVAELIRSANGMGAGELPEAGEVLLVPGS